MSTAPTLPWKEIYALFDPMQKLEGETLRFFVSRSPTLLTRIEKELEFSRGNYHAMFVGQRGSGKSSELRRLAERMEDKDLFTILIDVDELTDLFNVNHVEVLYLMGVSIYGAAQVKGLNPDRGLLKKLIDSIQTLVREQTENKNFNIDINELLKGLAAGVGVAVGGAIGGIVTTAVNLFKGVKFSLGVSEKAVRKLEVKPQIGAIAKALNNIVDDVKSKCNKDLLVVVDGLDRVEFEQGKAIFAESQVLSQPRCHLIYVIPSHLYYSPVLNLAKQIFQNVHLLSNIKLHSPGSDDRYVPGYELMQQVVDQRLQSVNLRWQAIFSAEALDLLIKMSGGLMREFIRLVRNAVINAVTSESETIDREAAEAAVDALRRDYLAGITDPLVAELIALLETGVPSGTKEGEMLLQNAYILCQSNRDLWYEVHPVLVDFVAQEQAKRRGRGSGESNDSE